MNFGPLLISSAQAQSQTAPPDRETLNKMLLQESGLPGVPRHLQEESRKLFEGLLTEKRGASGRVFGLCGSGRGEGVTTICCALVSFSALSANNVLWIDANTTSPLPFSADGRPGLSELFLAKNRPHEVIHTLANTPVSLLGLGSSPDLMASQAFEENISRVIQELRELFRIVVIDLASPVASPFSARLARFCDSVGLVLEANRTDRAEVDLAISALQRASAPLAGLILNRRRFDA